MLSITAPAAAFGAAERYGFAKPSMITPANVYSLTLREQPSQMATHV